MSSWEALCDEVERILHRGLPAHVAPYAAWDADGTLWHGDLGELAFHRGYDAGMIRAETVIGPLTTWASAWGVSLPGDPARAFATLSGRCAADQILESLPPSRCRHAARADLYGMQAWAYAGHTPQTVERYGAALFEEALAGQVHPWVKPMWLRLRAMGVRMAVYSGTHCSLIAGAIGRWGIVADDVRGSSPARDDEGRFVPSPGCALYGRAKAEALAHRLRDLDATRPLLAFGDAVETTDREMLALAHLPVAVAPRGEHAVGAQRRGYRILPA